MQTSCHAHMHNVTHIHIHGQVSDAKFCLRTLNLCINTLSKKMMLCFLVLNYIRSFKCFTALHYFWLPSCYCAKLALAMDLSQCQFNSLFSRSNIYMRKILKTIQIIWSSEHVTDDRENIGFSLGIFYFQCIGGHSKIENICYVRLSHLWIFASIDHIHNYQMTSDGCACLFGKEK